MTPKKINAINYCYFLASVFSALPVASWEFSSTSSRNDSYVCVKVTLTYRFLLRKKNNSFIQFLMRRIFQSTIFLRLRHDTSILSTILLSRMRIFSILCHYLLLTLHSYIYIYIHRLYTFT